MSTAADWFDDEADFRRLCGDAQSQARGESSQEFAAEMIIKAKEHGLATYLSPKQLRVALQAGRLGSTKATRV